MVEYLSYYMYMVVHVSTWRCFVLSEALLLQRMKALRTTAVCSKILRAFVFTSSDCRVFSFAVMYRYEDCVCKSFIAVGVTVVLV